MKRWIFLLVVAALIGPLTGPRDSRVGVASAQSTPTLSFFVSSAKSKTGNLGGLEGADRICQTLAAAVGLGNNNWRAYLSVERDPSHNNQPTDARSRIGNGPWFNASGVMVAKDLAEVHARKGDAAAFVDERGQRVPGNWPDSPKPTEHDILTGSTAEGRVMPGKTCNDWTSESSDLQAQVGHSDGLGPGGDPSGRYAIWNSSHENGSCANTSPRGGAGRIYCFLAR
ncbi:MAG TPA: hypothetical protein VIE89_14330 [Candidatus Binatia bacterium]